MTLKNFRIILAVCLSVYAASAIRTIAQKAELVVQTGHAANVLSVAFSPDGKTLASGSDDKTIRLWEVESGKEVRTLTGHSYGVWSVAFTPDGKTLASGSDDLTIKIWNIESGRELRTLVGHTAAVRSVAFSPDGKTLASGSRDNTIKIWETESGKEIRTLAGHSSNVWSVAFSPNGKTLASGSEDRTVKLWDVASGQELRTLRGHSDVVMSIAYSPDGKTIASASNDKTIMVWDAESGRDMRILTGHSYGVLSVAFSRDGKTLASGSEDSTIKIWSTDRETELRTLEGHSLQVLAVAFSPDGRTLASGSMDKAIKLWHSDSGRELRTLTGTSAIPYSVAYSPDGKTLATGSEDKTIRIWDVENGRELRTLRGHDKSVMAVAFSPDGKTLASASSDYTIKLWDTESGRESKTLRGHSSSVKAVTFSPDGTTLASGSNDKTIKIWDVKSGKELRTLAKDLFLVTSLAFSPDGKTLASTGYLEEAIKILDTVTGNEVRTLRGESRFVMSFDISPDGKFLASGYSDMTIKIWDIESGRESRALTSFGPVASVAFSPDGKKLALGGRDKTIKIWDTVGWKEMRTLSGHSSDLISVSFSADGKSLASGSDDGTTKIWNTMTGELICTLIAIGESDWAVTTPDGRFDTNRIEDSQGLHWVVSDDPLKPIPLEIFMRDYYEPQLLPRLIRCNRENNCEREFKPVRDISKLNRVQPPVKISNVSLPDAEGYVTVSVEVGKGEGKYLVNGKESSRTTGVYDLRLFRDGQIVGSWPGDGAEKLLRSIPQDFEANAKATNENRPSEELRSWQQASEIQPNDSVKIDPKSGAMSLPSFRVRLPRGKDVSAVDFSAYAFNEDRIKSQTTHWQWPDDLKAKLPKAQQVKPRAYVIAVGVNAYENPDFDLEFAADDARRMSEVLTEKLNATGQYERVIPVTLISDYETKQNQKMATQKQATKENFRAVLGLLAGRNADRALFAAVKNADQLQRATPDDLVIIMYSSHGYADRAGNFYFIPYDTGPGKGKVFTESVRRHSISSEELSLWLRDVDAGEMVMIVDACHSTAAVAGQDFKPGPMGSRGLGQLSYDKGMRILTATQSDNVAWEYPTLRQGMLTYALLRDGIEAKQADFKPRDQTIMIEEWLAFGVERVPKLYEEVRTGKVQSFGLALSGQPKLVVTRDGKPTSGSKALEEVLAGSGKSGIVQQPSLFDFTRKKKPVVLAKTN